MVRPVGIMTADEELRRAQNDQTMRREGIASRSEPRAEALREAALEAFDKAMDHVEPWASGSVAGKHRSLFGGLLDAALAARSEPRAGHNDDECPYRERALAAIREDLATQVSRALARLASFGLPPAERPPVVEESELDGDPMALAWDATPPAEGMDARILGMAMDIVDETDAIVGVVNRGTKAERVVGQYNRLAALAPKQPK